MYKPDAPISRLKYWLSIALLVMWFSAGVELRADQTIVIRSGNGSIGSQDSLVHALPYGTTGDITPTAAQFASAQAASFAYVVSPFQTYIPMLPSDPSAKWIATTPNLSQGSALFAMPFQVNDPSITSAGLDFHFSVDNAVNGVFINGTRISGNSFDGDYHAEYRFVRNDIASLLIPNSTNWLYVNMSDYGGLAALIFNATITTNSGGIGTQGVTPNHGGNTGGVTVRVNGTGFQPGAQLKLTGIGPDILGTGTAVLNTNTLISTIDLTNAQAGLRNLVVSNPDATSTTQPGAFTVEQGGAPQIWIDVVGPPRMRFGREGTFYITLGNTGNIDAVGVPIWIEVPNGVSLDLGFSLVPVPGAAATSSLTLQTLQAASATNSIPFQVSVSNGTVAGLLLPVVPSGSSFTIPVVLGASSALAAFPIQTWARPPFLGTMAAQAAINDPYHSLLCLADIGTLAFGPLGEPITQAIAGASNGLLHQMVQSQLGFPSPPAQPQVYSFFQFADLANQLAATNTGIAIPPPAAPFFANAARSVNLANTFADCSSVGAIMLHSLMVQIVTSVDPNDKFGAQGFGAAHFLSGTQMLPYSIYFDNQPTASAPAQSVTVTDTLDGTLDLNTATLGPISFPGQLVVPPSLPLGLNPFTAVVDLRPARNLLVKITASLNISTRIVTWTLQSLDPASNQPPTDPLAGFLPPGAEGSVFLSIMPDSTVATGAMISNSASVIFDVNSPISTPAWFNTVDKARPTSLVATLPSTQSSYSFPVLWSGADVGSGIQDFTVYASDDGGPFTACSINTASTQATYMGVGGHTYSFYSIARDLVGNLENLKTNAEATTQVIVDTTPPQITPQISGTLGNNGWYRSGVAVNWTVTDPESGIASSSGCAPTTLTSDTAGATLTCSATNGAGLSASVPVTIKIDTTPPVTTASANPSTLWPPNGKVVNVTVSVTITDATSGVNPNSAKFAVVDQYGSVQPSGNVTLAANGTYFFTISLQASRLGTDQNGRAYTITITAQDNAGNQTSAVTTVVVPHDQGH